ncbi:MAG: adenosylmethionine decarboxylase [Deferrisomatales bacterium]
MRRTKRLRLQGFNNLTKALSFNIYDICYARTPEARREYLEYIDEEYNSDRLTRILREVADIIGANILNLASQDYDPMGASVTVLVAEEPVGQAHVAHLDKSHLAAHTYPEADWSSGLATFRVDIDVSTCGKISPLRALNHLIRSFESEVVVMDYRVRGFTRDVKGRKIYLDHSIHSIQEFIDREILDRYSTVDTNIYQENLFHTKMMLRDLDLDRFLFGDAASDRPPEEREHIRRLLEREITEIFYGKNIFPRTPF